MLKTVSPILTLLVDNEFGVLTRVSYQIRREGWNIKSLTVAETTNPAVSRITLCLECYEVNLPGVLHKLRRLQCVRSVIPFDPEHFVCRELAVLRFTPRQGCKLNFTDSVCQLKELCRQGEAILLEATGSPEELTACLQALQALGEVEAARTGAITLEKAHAEKEKMP